MKSLHRGCVGWPGKNSEIEAYVKTCGICQISQPLPLTHVHPWDWTRQPWSRFHLHFAGKCMGCM